MSQNLKLSTYICTEGCVIPPAASWLAPRNPFYTYWWFFLCSCFFFSQDPDMEGQGHFTAAVIILKGFFLFPRRSSKRTACNHCCSTSVILHLHLILSFHREKTELGVACASSGRVRHRILCTFGKYVFSERTSERTSPENRRRRTIRITNANA